jgi:hypothetical protein
MPAGRTTAAIESGWAALEAELDVWASTSRTAAFWWRDDDAVTWTSALERLLELAEDTPIGLAVIPGKAQAELAQALAVLDTVTVIQHGWRHINHGTEQQKSEFGCARPLCERLDELAAGWDRLKPLFGSRALAVLVPPWNQIGEDLIPLLASIGFRGLSRGTIAPCRRRATLPIIGILWRPADRRRRSAKPAPGLQQVNVHADLIDWGGGRGFIGETEALSIILRHLKDRRLHRVDSDEPIGIVTHHLVQDVATEHFLGRLIATLRRHPVARFVPIPELFPAPSVNIAKCQLPIPPQPTYAREGRRDGEGH